jgi:hypothetical protein
MKYTITVVYARSEASYTFGPFDEAVLDHWVAKMAADHPENSIQVDVLNPPKLYGTGEEMS